MAIDITVGILAGLIVIGLLLYFIFHGKKKKCNCAPMKKYKKDLEKAKKEITKK